MKDREEKHNIESNEPVYFLNLSVENVRCFGKKQTLDLSDDHGKPARWTVILGDNGTGKTTLLQCLAGLEPRQVVVSNNGQQEPLLVAKGNSWEDKGIINLNRYRDNLEEKGFWVETSRFYVGFIHSDTFQYLKGNRFISRAGIVYFDSELEIPKEEYHRLLRNLIIYAYGASRHMGYGSLEDTQHDEAAISLLSDDVSLVDAEEWLLQAYLTYKHAEGEELEAYTKSRYEKIKNTLIMLLDDVEDIRVKPITKEQLKAVVEAKTPYGWVDMKDLSLGYKALIAWVVDLASRLFDRYPDSENPLAEPAIVLVDEIDLHLHPKWQRIIITYLTDIFKNTQFIVTAHSPLVVQAMPKDANIVLLKREGDQVIIHNDKEKDIIYGWRLDQLITSDLFDVPSSRPFQYDKLLKRRNEILSKAQLGTEDQKELEEVEQQLEELPVTDSLQDHQAMELIRKAAQILKPHIDKIDDKNNKAIKHT